MMKTSSSILDRAQRWIQDSDGLIIAVGAGMGVDSGLPDFRGTKGFWRSYPALARSGPEFAEIARPSSFAESPLQAWGFYGYRLVLYRTTTPHEGFHILRRWGEEKENGYFVFTSNVDGQFQAAGFDSSRILEAHGSLHYLQCLQLCSDEIWPADNFQPKIDTATGEVTSPLPRCRRCNRVARPHVLMFEDWKWVPERKSQQRKAYEAWRKGLARPVVIEIGAGRDVPTVRYFSESSNARVIRINPADDDLLSDDRVVIGGRALDTLLKLNGALLKAGAASPPTIGT